MSLTRSISDNLSGKKKNIFPTYFHSLQLSLPNFLHLCCAFAFPDSCNLSCPLTPPLIALYACKCPFVFCLAALTHIIVDRPSKLRLTFQSTNLLHFREKT